MTYQDIMQALENGKLYEINVYNESMCKLQESQYKDCFIKGILK